MKMKKTLSIIIIIILTTLVSRNILNKIIVSSYENNIYNSNFSKILYVLNFNQPYIAYYNNGNILQKENKYDQAITSYKKALRKRVPKNKICDIRINLSLAIIKNISTKDKDKILKELRIAKNNLYENDCAHKDDDNGYSKQAEKLKNEIIELENSIKNNSESNSKDKNKNDEENDEEKNKNIEEELLENRKKSESSRQSDLEHYENITDYDYYDGKRW